MKYENEIVYSLCNNQNIIIYYWCKQYSAGKQ